MMDDREREIEEEVVALFSELAIDAQVCGAEDLGMMIDAVETELAVYYTRTQSEQRGVSTAVNGSNWGSALLSPQERQAKVQTVRRGDQKARARKAALAGLGLRTRTRTPSPTWWCVGT